MLKEISVEQFLNLNGAIAVDVRSPIEFREGSIPGAINLPLFSDEERSEIGTIYKMTGQNAAKWRAMEVVSPKIPFLMAELKKLIDDGKVPVINCWRGGMRSKSVCTFMEYSGLSSIRLTGGYKNYRQYILSKVTKILPEKAIVIHGKTGVGKTEILHRLKAKGYPVLDLEGIAGHRGSIFGAIGLGDGNNQKNFDALLFSALSQLESSPYFIMEAESKRIGRVVQPEELLNKKDNGLHLYLETSIHNRVDQIVSDYVHPYCSFPWFKEKVQECLEKVEKRLNTTIKNELNQRFSDEDWYSLIQILLEDYYDSKYDYKRSEYVGNFVTMPIENIDQAVDEIEVYIANMNLITNGQLKTNII